MRYKTMALELIRQWPEIHERLRRGRRLLRTVNAHAAYLRARHHAWMNLLRGERQGSEPNQISGEALELALEDLRESLRQESSTDESGTPPVEEAMAYLRRHTPPG